MRKKTPLFCYINPSTLEEQSGRSKLKENFLERSKQKNSMKTEKVKR